MSTTPKPQFIRPPHSLGKAIVGDGPARMDPELLKKAEAVVKEMERDFPDWADEYLDRMRAALNDATADPAGAAENLQQIFTLVMDLKGQAGSYGYQMLTQLGDLLKSYTEELRKVDGRSSQIIEAHVDAMQVALRQRIKGDGGDVGRQIVGDLQKLVDDLS